MARLGFLTLDGSHPRDGVSIKILVVLSPRHHCPLISEKCQKLEIIQIPAQGLELYVKLPGVPADVPRLSSGDLVVIMLLLRKSGRKNWILW